MSLGMELTGNVILSTNSVSGDVLTRTTMVSGNVNQALSVKSAEWGNITGTLSNQTDLNTALEKINGVFIREVAEKYPITSMSNGYTDEMGIKWFVIHVDDGSFDGIDIYLPNHQGMQTINQIVMSAIPTDNSQLANGSGYITGIDSTMISNALGYTPYDGQTNPEGFFVGPLTSADIANSLGFTPYSDANPNNYTSDSALSTEDIDEVCV